MQPLTEAEQETLNQRAAETLGLDSPVHIDTRVVRHIDDREVQALFNGGVYSFRGYAFDPAGFLSAATFSMMHRTKTAYAAVPRNGGAIPGYILDTDQEVGLRGWVDVRLDLGEIRTATIYSTPEAEQAAWNIGYDVANRLTNYYIDAEPDDEGAIRLPLLPVFGSRVTLSAIVKDAPADDVERRIRSALFAEFGDALGVNISVNAHPVGDPAALRESRG